MYFLNRLANLLYPPACALCQTAPAGQLCEACRLSLPLPAAVCGQGNALACWEYTGTARQIIHQFKYKTRWRLGVYAAQQMSMVAKKALCIENIDLVVSVPSHWLTRRLRGFEAAAFLAEAVAGQLGKPHSRNVLRKNRLSRSQTRLTQAQRLRNVRGSFSANCALVAGRHILLVDDVLTSGATAAACAEALKQAQAARVSVLTAARTPLS